MKHGYFQHLVLSGTLLLALGACGHKPTKTLKMETPLEATSPQPQSQQVVLLQEARAEAESLRAELASLKILMAKQMGEFQSFKEQNQSIQRREQDQGQELQAIRSQLLSSQAERDQLRKRNIELEGQVANMPDTSQLVSDIQALHGSFQQIMSNMKGLASDMRLIKQEMHISTKALQPKQTKLTNRPSTEDKIAKPIPDSSGHIIIQEGDTLWELARTYDVTVEQLQEWNNLTSDLILTGLPLRVAEPMEQELTQPEQVKTSDKPSSPMVKKENSDSMGPNTLHQTKETDAEFPTTSTHILSIAPPTSESHESP